MKSRSYQKMHNYILGNFADITESLKNTPVEHQGKIRAAKELAMKEFFLGNGKGFPLIEEWDRKKFRTALRTLKSTHLEALLFPTEMKVSEPYPIPDDKQIAEQFQKFETKHAFFTINSVQALAQFKKYFIIAKLIGDFIERNNGSDNKVAFEHAYKLLVLFGNKSTTHKLFEAFEAYLQNNNFREKKAQLHDALIWELPKKDLQNTPIHLSAWRDIIYATGPKACRLFGKACEIEEKLDHRAPNNFSEVLETGKLVTYKKLDQDSAELASLFMFYNISEETFNHCLEIKKRIKKRDNLPQITVAGSDVGKPGYHLVKLPIHDPRAFILGYLTECCQSIGGASEQCVIDGITLENNGFYVLLREKKKNHEDERKASEVKSLESAAPLYQDSHGNLQIDYSHFEIVGQAYTWLSITGNLVFDSWENLRPEQREFKNGKHCNVLHDDEVIVPMLEKFAQLVTEHKDSAVLQVAIGKGGKTPRIYRGHEKFLCTPEEIKEGNQYDDSSYQSLVYHNDAKHNELFLEISQALKSKLKSNEEKINLENFISGQVISSKLQAIQLIAFINNNKILHAQLLDKEFCLQLEKVIKKCSNIVWNLFALLDANNLYDENTFTKFAAFAAHYRDYYTIYKTTLVLSDFELLNASPNPLAYLMKNWKTEDWDCIVRGLDVLHKAGLYSEDLVNEITSNNIVPAYWKKIAESLSALHKENILSHENRLYLYECPKEANWTASVLIGLSNKKDFDYVAAFKNACYKHHESLIKIFIERKLVDLQSKELNHVAGYNYFQLVVLHKNVELLKLLINAKAIVDHKNDNGDTALILACNNSGIENKKSDILGTIKLLIEEKANVNTLSPLRGTPLITCLNSGLYNAIPLLVESNNLVFDKNYLFDENLFWDFKKEGKIIFLKILVALHETEILNKENVADLIKNHLERLIVSDYSIIITLHAANSLNAKVFDMFKRMSSWEQWAFKLLIERLSDIGVRLDLIKLENIQGNEFEDYKYLVTELDKNNLASIDNVKQMLHSDSRKSARILKQLLENKGKSYPDSFFLTKILNKSPKNLSEQKAETTERLQF